METVNYDRNKFYDTGPWAEFSTLEAAEWMLSTCAAIK